MIEFWLQQSIISNFWQILDGFKIQFEFRTCIFSWGKFIFLSYFYMNFICLMRHTFITIWNKYRKYKRKANEFLRYLYAGVGWSKGFLHASMKIHLHQTSMNLYEVFICLCKGQIHDKTKRKMKTKSKTKNEEKNEVRSW